MMHLVFLSVILVSCDNHMTEFLLPIQETLFYEKTDYYIIIGILCGLAIYNSITVYLPFPITLYKKLLDRFVLISGVVYTHLYVAGKVCSVLIKEMSLF